VDRVLALIDYARPIAHRICPNGYSCALWTGAVLLTLAVIVGLL
jgi:hypothetical protein